MMSLAKGLWLPTLVFLSKQAWSKFPALCTYTPLEKRVSAAVEVEAMNTEMRIPLSIASVENVLQLNILMDLY